MSLPPQSPRGDDDAPRPTDQSTGAGRRRGRLLIPGIFIGVIALIFLFILLVSQIGQ